MSFSVFGDKSRLLPAFSKPYPDEILSSWLTRLSFDHGLNNARLLKMLLDKKDTNNWHVDRSFNDEQIAALAAYTNCSPDEIKNTTLLSYENRLYEPQSKSVVPSTWTPKKHISKHVCLTVHKEHSGLFFCPGCLSRPNRPVYFRKQWRLAISFVCPGCGCYLKETCPHCKSGGSSRCMRLKESLDKTIDEYLLACHQCQEDISLCMAEAAPEHLIKMQKQLYHIMEHEPGKGKISSASYFGVLYQMVVLLLSKSKGNTLFGLIRDVYHTHQVPLLNRYEFRQDVHELAIKQRAGVFYMAHWLLEQWPNRFINLCQDHRLHSEEILRYFKNAPEWFWQPVVDELDDIKCRVPEVYHEEKEPDRSIIRIRDERLNRFLYDYDTDDSFYSIDMDGYQLPEVDRHHATYQCRQAGILHEQMRDMEGWYEH